MALQIQALEKEDISEATRLHLRAFATDPLVNAIYPGAAESPNWLQHISTSIETGQADPSQHLMKITLPEDGHLMGIGQWEGCSRYISSPPSTPKPPPNGANIALVTAYRKQRSEKRAAIMGDRPHYYLALLATESTYRRQGVARTLVEWGTDRASAEGVEAYLESGPAALPFYSKMGFHKVDTMAVAGMDPGEDGVQNEIYCLLWRPQTISSK
ncbi:hypothetical protein PV11_02068 [Exophiala sideris]|uniref:N-acetyltransferase domain-containing protein n=1 Tax=Exophiala sideris TaxID=1016849 RepID=A0A0D1YV65_9EURO|nr:hypothetical protein PV11_02068 [Exophiala sideris]